MADYQTCHIFDNVCLFYAPVLIKVWKKIFNIKAGQKHFFHDLHVYTAETITLLHNFFRIVVNVISVSF